MKNTIPIRVRMLVFASVMLSLQSVDVCQALPAQTADASAASGEQLGDSKPDTTTSTDNDSKAVQSLIAGLGAKSFEVRAEASKQLKTLPNEQIRRMSELAAGQASAEVIVRILAEVDNRYSNGDTKQQELASETLEALISAERILLAELA